MISPERCLVLVDRDGTINREVNHLADPDRLELLPGAAEGLIRMEEAGLPLVVVTNQAQIGRGLLSEERLQEIHARLDEMLTAEGVHIRRWYWCPHPPEDHCDCRKPRPRMLHRAIKDQGGTLERLWMIGDKLSDLQAGRAVSAGCILVATGYGAEHRKLPESRDCVDHFVPSLVEASEVVLRELQGG